MTSNLQVPNELDPTVHMPGQLDYTVQMPEGHLRGLLATDTPFIDDPRVGLGDLSDQVNGVAPSIGEQVGWITPGERRFAKLSDRILLGGIAVGLTIPVVGIAGYAFRHRLDNFLGHSGSDRPAGTATDYANAPAGSASGLGAPESPATIVIEHGPEASEAPKIPGDTMPPTAPSTEAAPDSTLEVADPTTASSGTSTTEASTTSTAEITPASPTTIATTATTAAPTTSRPPSTSVETTPSTAAPTTQTTRPPQTTGTTRSVTTITSAPPSSPGSTEELPVLTVTLPPPSSTPAT